MKAVFIVYQRGLEENVREMLREIKVPGYTEWSNVTGSGETGPHLGSHVWPDANNAVLTIVETTQKDEILNRVKALNDAHPKAGIRAFVTSIEEMV